MKTNTKAIIFAITLFGASACGQDPDTDTPQTSSQNQELTKGQAKAMIRQLPPNTDICAQQQWYGDGVCDAFCPNTDQDCATPNAPTCAADQDCISGESCISGQCDVAQTPACTSDADCAQGQVCVSGQCDAAPIPACTSDADCAQGQACISGQCAIPTPPPSCSSDADCARGEQCVAGQCEVPTSPCTPQAEVCDQVDNDCDGLIDEDNACAAFCRLDSDCAPSQACVQGQCAAPPTSCQTHADCPQDHYCQRSTNQCVLRPTSCQTDADCSANQACFQGQCQDASQCIPQAEVCDQLDNDCDGLIDEDNVCAVSCQTDADCAPSQACVQGQCAAPVTTCASDADCPSGQQCNVRGTCQP